MKHLRKCTALLLAVLMVFALAACGEKDTGSAVDKDLTVNVVSLNGTTGFGMAKLMADSKAGNAALNYSFTVETDPSNATAALVNGTADIAALPTNAAKDDVSLVHQMIDAMNDAANSMERSLQSANSELGKTMETARGYLGAFNKTVGSFNDGVRDFSEFNYSLQGTVERMDVAIRDFVGVMRQLTRGMEKGGKQ